MVAEFTDLEFTYHQIRQARRDMTQAEKFRGDRNQQMLMAAHGSVDGVHLHQVPTWCPATGSAMTADDPRFEEKLAALRAFSEIQVARQNHDRYSSALELRRRYGIRADPNFDAWCTQHAQRVARERAARAASTASRRQGSRSGRSRTPAGGAAASAIQMHSLALSAAA